MFFFSIICEILIEMLQISGEEKLIWRVWLLRSTAVTSIERYVGQSAIAFIYDVA